MSKSDEELDELEATARQVPGDLAGLERGPEAFRKRMREAAARKQQVTIRLDADIVSSFKQLAGDGSYQALINRALHEWLDAKSVRGLLEEAIEKIVRERKAHG
jgi:uncharacterized protein (DUF4415 family)